MKNVDRITILQKIKKRKPVYPTNAVAVKLLANTKKKGLKMDIIKTIIYEILITETYAESEHYTEIQQDKVRVKCRFLADKIARQLEPLVSDANGGHWQKCPKCDGQGIVSKPPWIAGDQDTWTASQTNFTCNLCNGQMVIKQ